MTKLLDTNKIIINNRIYEILKSCRNCNYIHLISSFGKPDSYYCEHKYNLGCEINASFEIPKTCPLKEENK